MSTSSLPPLISVVTPALNEVSNLPLLYRRLAGAIPDWEWIVVDDHSSDGTFDWVRETGRRDPRVRGIRMDRHSGSHSAIRRGLAASQGAATAVLAADLENPPEALEEMTARWRSGAPLVWAVRSQSTGLGSRLFYEAARRTPGMPALPRHGAAFFLADRTLVNGLREHPRNVFLQLAALDVRQDQVVCQCERRRSGSSRWTWRARTALALESFHDFTLEPALYRLSQKVLAPGGSQEVYTRLRKWPQLWAAGLRHLDAGCGPASWLWEYGIRPVGIDNAVARAAVYNRRSDAVAACATRLPFADGSFDVTWSFGMLHHCSDAGANAAVADMIRVTRAGGWIVVFDGVPPESPLRHPMAALVRGLDRGGRMRDQAQLSALLGPLARWSGERIRYSLTGLEGLLFITRKE